MDGIKERTFWKTYWLITPNYFLMKTIQTVWNISSVHLLKKDLHLVHVGLYSYHPKLIRFLDDVKRTK